MNSSQAIKKYGITFGFGAVLEILETTQLRVRRASWPDNTWIMIETVQLSPVQRHVDWVEPTPWIGICIEGVDWTPFSVTHTDLLAKDWEIYT